MISIQIDLYVFPNVAWPFKLCCIFMIYLRFLDEVQSHANENKMSVQNLATVFGPNILRAKMEDPVSMMEGKANNILVTFAAEYVRINMQ